MTAKRERSRLAQLGRSVLRIGFVTAGAIVFSVLALAVSLALGGGPDGFAALRARELRDVDSLIAMIRPLLSLHGKGGRIEFIGACDASADVRFPEFPTLRKHPRSVPILTVGQLRSTFRDDGTVRISETSDAIRIDIGDAPNALLETALPRTDFAEYAPFNPEIAMWQLEDSHEVVDALHALGWSRAGSWFRHSFAVEPADGLPHLPATLPAMTFGAALDRIASTFGGVVIYGVCDSPRAYFVEFAN